MALIVQKYGGSSVGDLERIRNVAKRVEATAKQGHRVVVVVSAMSGETNRLVALSHDICKDPVGREYDMLLSTGEQVTTALLAMALNDRGCKARAMLGHQVHILTDSAFSKARIKSIDHSVLNKELDAGYIVIVAGFQGMDSEGNITTLGRGGSDTTAVALAAALQADACEIYTDVDGVFTADPRICPDARQLAKISYEEMLEMASMGAKVLQIRSVEMGSKYNVPLWVKNSFNNKEGTLVTQEDQSMEHVIVSGVAHDTNEAKVAVRRLADRPGIAAKLFDPIAQAGINVDMIVQNVSADGFTDITFTMPRGDLKKAIAIVEKESKTLGAAKIESDSQVAKISVIGVGMRSHAGVAAKMFSTLAEAGINIQMISTSEIKISILIEEKNVEKAVRVLHKAFDLGKK